MYITMLIVFIAIVSSQKRGKDVQAAVAISFFESVLGCEKEMEFEYYETKPVAGKGGQRQRVRKTKKVKISIPPGMVYVVVVREQHDELY